jgi:hypothetical protein
MQKLRRLHLYLGCFFAPMLLFFTISGIWQTVGWNDHNAILRWLSTIHKNQGLKGGAHLNSFPLELFVLLMSLGLILSVVTGIVMAFKFGRGKITLASLAAGILIPLIMILASAL